MRLAFPAYRQGDWLDEIIASASLHLEANLCDATTWASALDGFEGVGMVPLMTIHKSKGLEYHTVIFARLDDQAWWSFRGDPREGRSTFFVAFSRAQQRVRFTYSRSTGTRQEVRTLYDLLHEGGVPQREFL